MRIPFVALIFGFLIFSILLAACEDIIDINTEVGEDELVIDAWLTDQTEMQVIRLSKLQPYFLAEGSTGVEGAQITLRDDRQNDFIFEDIGDGYYRWKPEGTVGLGSLGTAFEISIRISDRTYLGRSTIRRVPIVDSITYEFRTDELGGPDGIYAQFFARDFRGLGDCYWIKAFKNGKFLNKPQELNIAFDAAFDGGSETDGIVFIPPIREAINRIADPDGPDDENKAPWETGDTIRVEIHSITLEAFDFLNLARDQMTNGDNTIFSIPLANTRGNVFDLQSARPILGIFNVASVQSATLVIR